MCFVSPGARLDAGEAVEGERGGDVGVGRGEVEFSDLFAGAFAGVFYVGFDGECVAGVEVEVETLRFA